MGGIRTSSCPKEVPHAEFEGIEDITNYLLEHKEVIDYIKGRGGSRSPCS